MNLLDEQPPGDANMVYGKSAVRNEIKEWKVAALSSYNLHTIARSVNCALDNEWNM